MFRPLAASKGKKRIILPRPSFVVRPYGDVQSRGTSLRDVASEMAAQRDMQVRARRLADAIARGLVTQAMERGE